MSHYTRYLLLLEARLARTKAKYAKSEGARWFYEQYAANLEEYAR